MKTTPYARFLDENDIDIWDTGSAVYVFLSLSVIMFAGEKISGAVNINLIVLYIVLFILYLGIRGIIQMKDHNARRTMVINVLSVVIIIAVLMCGLRSCVMTLEEMMK